MTDEDKKTTKAEAKEAESMDKETKEDKSPSTDSHSSLSDEAIRPQSRTAGSDGPSTGSGSDEKVEVPAKFKNLVEEIAKMSVLDLSELVKLLEDKFGVSSAAPVMAMAANAAVGGEAAEEEKSEFNVELTAVGDNKISIIKAIREITQIGLKEAKDMADGAPTMVKEGVKKEEAEAMKKKLEEAGGQVALK